MISLKANRVGLYSVFLDWWCNFILVTEVILYRWQSLANDIWWWFRFWKERCGHLLQDDERQKWRNYRGGRWPAVKTLIAPKSDVPIHIMICFRLSSDSNLVDLMFIERERERERMGWDNNLLHESWLISVLKKRWMIRWSEHDDNNLHMYM